MLAASIEEIRQEGKQEGKQEIVKNMLLKGFKIEEIADITGLSAEEIEKLKDK